MNKIVPVLRCLSDFTPFRTKRCSWRLDETTNRDVQAGMSNRLNQAKLRFDFAGLVAEQLTAPEKLRKEERSKPEMNSRA
jgi:hypothetical protein